MDLEKLAKATIGIKNEVAINFIQDKSISPQQKLSSRFSFRLNKTKEKSHINEIKFIPITIV